MLGASSRELDFTKRATRVPILGRCTLRRPCLVFFSLVVNEVAIRSMESVGRDVREWRETLVSATAFVITTRYVG